MRAKADTDGGTPGTVVLVLTTRLGPLPIAVMEGLREGGLAPVLVLMDNETSGRLSVAVRDYGWRYVISQAIDSAWRRAWSLVNARSTKQLPVFRLATRDWGALQKMAHRHGAAAIISVSFKFRIPAKLIDAQPTLLNLHPALLPEWRGADPIWWMRRRRDTRYGLTLHLIAKGIDEGDVFFSAELPSRRRGLTQASIECALASLARREIGAWMREILAGRAVADVQIGGHYWPLPTKANVRALSSGLEVRRR